MLPWSGSIKIPKVWSSESFGVGEQMEVLRDMPGEHKEPLSLFPQSLSFVSPYLAVLLYRHYAISNQPVHMFPWVLWEMLANYWTQRAVPGNPNLWPVRNPGDDLGLGMNLWSGGQSCGTEPLTTCGIWRCLQIVVELNGIIWHPADITENCWTCGEPTHLESKVLEE